MMKTNLWQKKYRTKLVRMNFRSERLDLSTAEVSPNYVKKVQGLRSVGG